ncbi:DEAD/DEAH box helicase [[Eubacterium] cellulosolvens]
MRDDAFDLLQKPLREQVAKLEIAEASDIQRLAIPPILDGKNALLIAPTGTGKTLAAVLPVFDLFVAARSRNETHGISILYVTPLRALNRDILRRLSDVGAELEIKVQVRHGDTAAATRALQARSPPDMLITTPETLQAILPGKRMRQHLKNVRWAIVDEIHELATDKRGVQLALGLERLRNLTGRDFQRIGLSATVGDEDRIAKFLAGSERAAVVVKSKEGRGFEAQVDYVSPTSADREQSEKFSVPPSSIGRARRIAQLIDEKNSVLVFTNTREHAEAVGSQLKALDSHAPVRVHHGSLSKEIREEVEQDFHSGSVKAVVCTSSLELGIDVGSVDFIIQYMSPRQAARLIQRIGRSEHRLRGVAKGVIVAASVDDILESAVIAQNAKNEKLEPTFIHENALDVLAHQIAGLILDAGRLTVEEAFETVKRAYPYRDLTPEAFISVVKQLAAVRVIRVQDEVLRPRSPNTFRYYFQNLSMIPDMKRYLVFDFFRKRKIGTLDQEFVARKCKSGTELIMHGQTWKVIAVNEDQLSVEVEPTAPTLNAIPSWEGEIIPVSCEVASEVGRLRGVISSELDDPAELSQLTSTLHMTNETALRAVESIRSQMESYPVPTDAIAVVEKFENCVILHACLGTLANETMSLALSSLLSARLGVYVAAQSDSYRVAFICPFKIEPRLVEKELRQLTPEQLEDVVARALEGSDTFAWRHWHVAKRFGAVERTAEYRASRARLLVKAFKGTPLEEETKREVFLEKLDLEHAREFIKRVTDGAVSLEIVEEREATCSPLALPIVDKIIPHGLLRPAVPSKSLTQIIRERLLASRVRLVCMYKGDWDGIRVVGELPETIRCPNCKSTLIAATYMGDDTLAKLVKRRTRGRKLPEEEEQAYKRAWLSASLMQTNGKKAAIVMSGRGVGPTTAVRVLRKLHRTEDDFYVDILKAEREYARTRLFWD